MATENFKEAGEIFQNAIEIEDPAKREQRFSDNPGFRRECDY